MKKILCFGDSNTYGFIPGIGSRFDINTRWSGIFKQALEKTNKYTVIEQGYSGRTCFSERIPDEAFGLKILSKYLTDDIDIVIFQIGINDTKIQFDITKEQIREGIFNFLTLALKCSKDVEIYVLSPPQTTSRVLKSASFNQKSIETAQKLINVFETVSIDLGCKYIDLNSNVRTSDIDGIHYDKESHLKIAQCLIPIFV